MSSKQHTRREDLLAQYDELEDALESAGRNHLWELADWLHEHIPNQGRGRPSGNTTRAVISITELAERRGRSQQWLNDLRKVAETTWDDRLDDVSPRVYLEALRACGWDLAKANERLRTNGTSLRDQSGAKFESVKAIERSINGRSVEERAKLVHDILADAEVSSLVKTGRLLPGPEERAPRGTRPQDRGWLPGAILSRALMSSYSSWAKMQDSQPPDEATREHCITIAGKIQRYMGDIIAGLQDDEFDTGLAELLDNNERQQADEDTEV